MNHFIIIIKMPGIHYIEDVLMHIITNKVLRAGNTAKHNEMLLGALNDLSKRVDAICMAQVSMSVLEPYLTDMPVPVYNSGRTGFERVSQMLEEMS